jgi:hypothetical protein
VPLLRTRILSVKSNLLDSLFKKEIDGENPYRAMATLARSHKTKGVGPGPTLAWPGWKQPDISVKVDTARLEAGQFKITINVPLFKKLRDIIFFWGENHFMSHFEGHFEGAKTFLSP